jgi:transcriptional regulator with PAS, ATPase and Fis domain
MTDFPVGDVLTTTSDSEKQSEKPVDSANGKGIAVEPDAEQADITLRSFRARAEVQAIRNVLGRTGWNRRRAAELLKISYRSLLYKIQRHNIAQ